LPYFIDLTQKKEGIKYMRINKNQELFSSKISHSYRDKELKGSTTLKISSSKLPKDHD